MSESPIQLNRGVIEAGAIRGNALHQHNADHALLFETLVELAPDAVLIADVDGSLTEANAAACQLLGYSREEILAKTLADLVAPEDASRLAADNSQVETWTYLHKDKRRIPAEVRSSTLPDGRWVSFIRDLRDRKQIEVTLREKEQQLQQLSNLMPQFVWMSSATGKLEYVNQQWIDYSGLTLEQSRDASLMAACFHPADRQFVFQQWEIAQETNQKYEFEARLKRSADGAYRWFLIRAVPAFDEQGQVISWYGTSTDIHDRKQAQLNDQFLSKLDLQLRQLSDPDAMVWEIVSSLGEYLNVDRCLWLKVKPAKDAIIVEQDWRQHDMPSVVGVHRMLDFSLPALIDLANAGQTAVISDVTTCPDTAPFAENFVALNIRAFVSVPYVYEGRWEAALVIHSKTVRNWRDDEIGLLQTTVARLWSMIEHTRAAQALRESEERLRLALMAANQGLYDLNVQTGAAIVSPEYARMLGYDPETFQETNAQWRERLHPDDREPVGQAFEAYIAGNCSEYRIEFRQRTQSGDWKWILSIGKIVAWDAEGQPLRMLGTHTDIDDRKRSEQERERLLAQKQAALQEAERVNRLKDDFFSALSHELRTPLNPILGWTKILQAQKLTPAKVAQALDTIERNVRQQINLVDDLLDVSRVIQGKLRLDSHPVDLALTLTTAIETVEFAAQAKAITLRINHTEPIYTLGDGDRLQQVFWNLLSNAIKFTPEGGWVEVRLERVEEVAKHGEVGANRSEKVVESTSSAYPLPAYPAYAQISVTDMGIGISPEFMPHIFEYFRQAEGGSSRKYGGLGLGLAIVRHLVELHGGTVTAASPGLGQGTTFTVRLPLLGECNLSELAKPTRQTTCVDTHVDAHPAASSLPAVAATSSSSSVNTTISSSSLSGMRILLVDDEPDNLELIHSLLSQAGATVTALTSASAALKVLAQAPPDLIISDIGMPEMNGYEFIQRVRALPIQQGGRVPAIALTAYAQSVDQERVITAGYQAYFSKPLNFDRVVAAIKQLVS